MVWQSTASEVERECGSRLVGRQVGTGIERKGEEDAKLVLPPSLLNG